MRRTCKEKKVIFMLRSAKKHLQSEKGFAFIAGLMACVILLALGALVVALSVGDIKSSSRLVGDKRAMTAVDKGVHRLIEGFNPLDLSASQMTTLSADSSVDSSSKYEVFMPCVPCPPEIWEKKKDDCTCLPHGPDVIWLKGYSQQWGLKRFNVDVEGENTKYKTSAAVNTGIGFGPVDTLTIYR